MTGGGLRILVVGGQAEDVRAVDAGVRDRGLAVDWIEPADAPSHLDAGDVLAVVLDLDNTGLAVARVFRDHQATRHIPLLFLAAPDAPAALKVKGYGYAPSDCLTRPVAPEVIGARAGLMLDLRPAAGRAELEAVRRGSTDRRPGRQPAGRGHLPVRSGPRRGPAVHVHERRDRRILGVDGGRGHGRRGPALTGGSSPRTCRGW